MKKCSPFRSSPSFLNTSQLSLIGKFNEVYLLEYDEENRNAWILLAEASIEYHSFKLSHPGGQSYAIMARDYFLSID